MPSSRWWKLSKLFLTTSRILVMDEPTSSMADKEVEFLFETMRKLTKKGVGIIYISHKMSELEEICDRVTVMRDGEYVGTKVVKETNKDELIAMMVGRELTNYYTREYQEPGEEVLRCEHISDGNMVQDVSFDLKKGRNYRICRTCRCGTKRNHESNLRTDKRCKRRCFPER